MNDQTFSVCPLIKYSRRVTSLAKGLLSSKVLLFLTLITCCSPSTPCSDPATPVHFVTHSMGGILVRYHLANQEMENLGRVVMLSPPNRGSELADWFGRSPILRELLGPSARQLGTDSASVPLKLGGVDYELGIVTGDRSLNPFFSDIIPGEDDGKVSVEGAKVAGMTDFIVVPYSHSYIMMRKEVIDQVIQFLERGMFDHRAEDRS